MAELQESKDTRLDGRRGSGLAADLVLEAEPSAHVRTGHPCLQHPDRHLSRPWSAAREHRDPSGVLRRDPNPTLTPNRDSNSDGISVGVGIEMPALDESGA